MGRKVSCSDHDDGCSKTKMDCRDGEDGFKEGNFQKRRLAQKQVSVCR